MSAYREFLERKRIRSQATGLSPRNLGDHLFPFQRKMVSWALERGRAAIFADCGLGKTVQQLEWASHIPGRVLVLTPLAVGRQTEAEGRRFGYETRFRESQEAIGPEKIVVTNYEKLDRFSLTDFSGLVIDESSILKSYTGAFRNRIITASSGLRWKLACTATPSPNDFMELGNHAEYLEALSRQEMLAMFFVHDGGSTQSWRLKGHAEKPFWRWVASWARLFTKPSDLGDSDAGFVLPPLRIERIEVEAGGIGSGGSLIPGALPVDLMARRRLRRESLSARCERAAELVMSNRDAWLLWCGLNAEGDLLAAAIPGAVQVKGSDSEEHKTKALLGFADGSVRVLVTKPRIAGFGMNWQACHQMVFVGVSDSYEALYQATRRCWRYGQTEPVTAWILTSASERAVVDNLLRKEAAHAEMQRQMVRIVGETS